MSKCWNCGKLITLLKEDVTCHSCHKVVNFQCHNCHNWFSIYDEIKEEKRKECGICGYFVCEHCGVCGIDCEKDLWNTQIMKILSPEISYKTIPNLQEKINKLLSFIEEIKISHEKKQCMNGVPITYAKGRIKTCIARTKGYRTKNEDDIKKFKERVGEILDKNIGYSMTINSIREEGSYGQEYRDVFNYCICLGLLEKRKIIKDFDGIPKEIEVYERVVKSPCKYLDVENILYKKCPKCKEEYSFKDAPDYCNCYQYKTGKNKGEFPKLKIKISNKDICQLNRGVFVKNGESGHI
jgi:hypothetical protein